MTAVWDRPEDIYHSNRDDISRGFGIYDLTGGSCGGFMTNWVVGHTDRFAAAVTQRSIVNQISFFGTADIGPECTERETGANAWNDLDAVWRQSPLAFADKVNTPLLIIHSDQDHRCPLEQAEQLFAADPLLEKSGHRWLQERVAQFWEDASGRG